MDQMGVREQIAADLSIDGEYLVVPQVVDAADFGVPQTRKRLLFVGVRASSGMTPPSLAESEATQAITLARFKSSRKPRYQVVVQQHIRSLRTGEALMNPEDASVVTAADAISDLVGLPVGNRHDVIPDSELDAPASAYQRLMREGAGATLANVQAPRINPGTKLRLRGCPWPGDC